MIGVSALYDGGYVVRWEADEEGLAVQRFDAQGAKVGEVVILQGISRFARDAEEVSYELTALDNGGYALTFGVEHETVGRSFNSNIAARGTVQFAIVGEPSLISVVNAPAGSTFSLRGLNASNVPVSEVLLVVNGEIVITQNILDRFSNDSRLTIAVTSPSLSAGSVSLFVETEATQYVDEAASLLPLNVGASGSAPDGTFFTGSFGLFGRLESFDLDNFTPASAGSVVAVLTVNPFFGASSVNINGPRRCRAKWERHNHDPRHRGGREWRDHRTCLASGAAR
jgi:hypothetical protein